MPPRPCASFGPMVASHQALRTWHCRWHRFHVDLQSAPWTYLNSVHSLNQNEKMDRRISLISSRKDLLNVWDLRSWNWNFCWEPEHWLPMNKRWSEINQHPLEALGHVEKTELSQCEQNRHYILKQDTIFRQNLLGVFTHSWWWKSIVHLGPWKLHGRSNQWDGFAEARKVHLDLHFSGPWIKWIKHDGISSNLGDTWWYLWPFNCQRGGKLRWDWLQKLDHQKKMSREGDPERGAREVSNRNIQRCGIWSEMLVDGGC